MNNESIIIISDSNNLHLYSEFYVENVTVRVCSFETTDRCLKEVTPEIAIMDCGFNISSGLELLTRIKSNFSHIPIIFLSSISSEDLVIKIFTEGARDFIKKPVSNEYLRLKIEKLLKIKKASREVRSSYTNINKSSESPILSRNLPSNIISALQYIENNITDNVSLSSLSKEANLSKHHFCRVFKKYIGKSPKRFIIDLKIERAKKLLVDIDNTVSTVAWEIGFNDLSSFIKHFKRTSGVTPSDYRKSLITLNKISA